MSESEPEYGGAGGACLDTPRDYHIRARGVHVTEWRPVQGVPPEDAPRFVGHKSGTIRMGPGTQPVELEFGIAAESLQEALARFDACARIAAENLKRKLKLQRLGIRQPGMGG